MLQVTKNVLYLSAEKPLVTDPVIQIALDIASLGQVVMSSVVNTVWKYSHKVSAASLSELVQEPLGMINWQTVLLTVWVFLIYP